MVPSVASISSLSISPPGALGSTNSFLSNFCFCACCLPCDALSLLSPTGWKVLLWEPAQSPSPWPSKNCSPDHSRNHTLILYCSQIYASLLSTRLLAASQGQGLCPRFWKPQSHWFPHCLPNGRITSIAPGAGSRKTVLWNLGESCLVSIKSEGGCRVEAAI